MQALLSIHPSSFSFSFSLPSSLTKEADPLADSAHVQRLIRIGVPWRRGTAWGACRLEACQRARKDPAPKKESRWRQGLHHPWTAPVSPNTPPSAPIQPVSREPSGGFWSGRMSQWQACLHSIGSQGPCWLLHNAAYFTDTLSQTHKRISCLRLHCCLPANIWLPVGKNWVTAKGQQPQTNI